MRRDCGPLAFQTSWQGTPGLPIATGGSVVTTGSIARLPAASKVERFYVDNSNNTSVITDRTPTSGYTADDQNVWQFDIETLLSGGIPTPQLIAQVAPNGEFLSNNNGGELFYGGLFDTTPLVQITTIQTGQHGNRQNLHFALFGAGRLHDCLITVNCRKSDTSVS